MAKSNVNPIICIDVETGGFSCLKNPITQIAFQSFNLENFEEIVRYDSYVLPYNNLTIEEQALKATGLTHQIINSKGKELKEVIKDVVRLFKESNIAGGYKKPILLGQNIKFDIGFIQYAFDYCKEDLSKLIAGDKDYKGFFRPEYFDTMWLSRLKWQGEGIKYDLSSNCQRAGVDLVDAHNAHNDVTATRELLIKLVSDLRNQSGGTSNNSDEIRHRSKIKFQF
jgi:DNA polymerase III epsilon subunit-like protein